MSSALIHQRDGPVTLLTLNRPEKVNALSGELVESLIEAVERAHDDGTRLLAFGGSGRHFCAGFDFTDIEQSSDAEIALRFIRIETLLQLIRHAPFRTVASVQGRNFGAGVDLIAACDVRIASPSASFRLPGLQFGVVLGTRRFAALVGQTAARDILASGRTFSAAEGLLLGLLTHVVDQDKTSEILTEQTETCALLGPEAQAALYRNTVADTRAEDMAALARSVSTPGLRFRIQEFRSPRG